MIRRLNFTGRKRIPADHVRIVIYKLPAGREFDARIRLDGFELPGSARIFVEAYHKFIYMRFDFGTVHSIQPPMERSLSAFYEGARVLFRVKIVASEDDPGKILAVADRIQPLSPDDRRDRDPLIAVRTVKGMNQQIWRVNWESGPVLELNVDEPEIKTRITADPRFRSLVLPELLRTVLTRILSDEMDSDQESEDGRVAARWLEFAADLHPSEPPAPEDRDGESIEVWVNGVVDGFCRRNSVLDQWRRSLYPGGKQLELL
jgi:hypothetical protein